MTPLLRRLDAAAVPRLQQGAQALARVVAWPVRAANRTEDRLLGGRPARFLHARRHGLLLAAALIAFAASAVHLVRYPEARQAAHDAANRAQEVRRPGDVHAAGATVVGPVIGDDLEAYRSVRAVALAEAASDATRLAVVSFETYLTADEAAGYLAGLEVVPLAVQLRLPADGERPVETEVVGDLPGSVARALAAERDRIADEEREIRLLLESETVTDEEYAAFYAEELERFVALLDLLGGEPAALFAVAVEGEVSDLRRLAQLPGVRLVDLAPAGAELGATRFYGLLPEERDRAEYGAVG